MEAFIQSVKAADKFTQALAVTAGGLIGVFVTLFVFFLIIAAADAAGKRSEKA